MTLKPWSILASDYVIDDRWYRLRKDCVRLPDGRIVDDYFVSERPDVAIVVPLDTEEHVVLVRQYKHGAGMIALEFPAGTFTVEDSSAAALRELAEETGYHPETLIPLGTAFEDVSRNTNRIHMFLALGCRLAGPSALDENEQSSGIETVRMPLASIRQRLSNGDIVAMSSLIAGYRALERLAEMARS